MSTRPVPPKPLHLMTPAEKARAREIQAKIQQQANDRARDLRLQAEVADQQRRKTRIAVADRAQPFLDALEALCREHNISIEHEDCHGAFVLVPFNDRAMQWMRNSVEIARAGASATTVMPLEGGPW